MIEVENKLYIKVGDLVEYFKSSIDEDYEIEFNNDNNNDNDYEIDLGYEVGLLNGIILKINEDKTTINILNNSGHIHEIFIKDVSWNYSCFENIEYWL